MSIFNNLFSNKSPTNENNTAEQTRFEMVTESGNGYYTWNGKMFHSDIIRACIRPQVKAVGKLVGKHVRENIKSDIKDTKFNPDAYLRFLLEDPNPYMSGQMLQEKMAMQLALNNNAFALISRDDNGYPIQIYPIPAVSAEAKYNKNAELLLKFYFKNGKNATFYYSDIIHLRNDYNENDIFGESPAPALTQLMDIIVTSDQGIVKAIKNSNVIKWLLKYKTSLRPEDMENEARKFVENYLSFDSKTVGVAATDSKADAERVEPKDYVPNQMILGGAKQRIYEFFNTNEKIVQSNFSENEWISYFESVIEPIAIQLSNEFTKKIFSRKERSFGNKIIFEASNLEYASMQTKLQLVQFVDRGVMSINEMRRYLNLVPIADGDIFVRRLDTAVVKEGENNK